jgi:MAF protein
MHDAVTIERPLVLASASPRRRELLGVLGLVFSIRIARIKEIVRAGESALDAVQRFAWEKASAVADLLPSQSYPIVVGADTIVVLDGQVLGKPVDAQEAEKMLRRLRGREHQVFTAISLINIPENTSHFRIVSTTVPMREYSDDEIYLYIRSGDPFDKAGAYAIQNPDFRPVVDLTGCYANVMGLPLCHLARELQSLGIEIRVDVPATCQKHLAYTCSEYPRVFAHT